jgi:ribosomal-protein-alanine N-acetyltransferase
MQPARDVQIGPFRPRHLARILAIERRAFAASAYTSAMFLDLYSRCGPLFFVARVARRTVGYVVTCVHGEKAEIVSIAVDPDYRRRGIAAALLQATLDHLRDSPVRRLELMVRVGNSAAIQFYRRYGFRRLGEVPAYYGKGHPGIRMRRFL